MATMTDCIDYAELEANRQRCMNLARELNELACAEEMFFVCQHIEGGEVYLFSEEILDARENRYIMGESTAMQLIQELRGDLKKQVDEFLAGRAVWR